jgi:hypothetical protein
MRTSGGCPLIGDNRFGVDIVPQLGAPIGNIYTYGETGVLLRIGRAGCRLRTRQNTPRVVWNGLFRRGGSRRRAGLLFFRRHTRAGRWSQHLPRRQLVSDEPERLEEESRRRRAGGILGPVVEIVAARISVALCTEEFHGQRTPDGGAQLYLVASARAGASMHTELAVTYRPAARGAPRVTQGIVGSSVVALGIFL